MRSLEILPTVVLTGAGFTRNFGGYLTSQMVTRIHAQAPAELRTWIDRQERHSNFEDLYDRALRTEDHALHEQFSSVLSDCFRQMDDDIRDRLSLSHSAVQRNPHEVFRQLISKFAGNSEVGTRGYFFTLNQDLLVERAWIGADKAHITLLGLTNYKVFHHARLLKPDDPELQIRLPSTPEIASLPPDSRTSPHLDSVITLPYVKLHGSINWTRSDGTSAMVVGNRKSDLISEEPLLRLYFQYFEDVLCRQHRKLVAIGYGFGDEHINAVIRKAISESALEIFVLNGPHWGYEEARKKFKEWDLPLSALVEVVPELITDLYEDSGGLRSPGRRFLGKLGIANYAQFL